MHISLKLYADDGTLVFDARFVPAGPTVFNLLDGGPRIGGHVLAQLLVTPIFDYEALEIARLADGRSVATVETINIGPEPRDE